MLRFVPLALALAVGFLLQLPMVASADPQQDQAYCQFEAECLTEIFPQAVEHIHNFVDLLHEPTFAEQFPELYLRTDQYVEERAAIYNRLDRSTYMMHDLPLGHQAHILVHEMTQRIEFVVDTTISELDSEGASLFFDNEDKLNRMSEQLRFVDEARAFNNEMAWEREIIDRSPNYKIYLKKSPEEPHIVDLPDRFERIYRLYKISPDAIKGIYSRQELAEYAVHYQAYARTPDVAVSQNYIENFPLRTTLPADLWGKLGQ